MNKLVDLRWLQHRFLILHGWQSLVDFIVGFLWITILFSIFVGVNKINKFKKCRNSQKWGNTCMKNELSLRKGKTHSHFSWSLQTCKDFLPLGC